MNNLLKSIKENTGAVITSLCILALVGFYVFRYIPINEFKINTYNVKKNRQFIKRAEELFREQSDFISPADISASQGSLTANSITKAVQLQDLQFSKAEASLKLERLILLSNPSTAVKSTKSLAFDTITAALDQYALKNNWALIYLKPQSSPLEAKPSFSIVSTSKITYEEIDSILHTRERHPYFKSIYYCKTYYAERLSYLAADPLNKLLLITAEPQYKIDTQARQTNIKFTLVLIILIVILILGIPLLKPLISSAQELLKQSDLLAVTASVTVLVIILSNVFAALFFNHNAENIFKKDLSELHKTEGNHFAKLTYTYKSGFKYVNNILKDEKRYSHLNFDLLETTITTNNQGASIKNAKDTPKPIPPPPSVHNLVSAFVLDKSGQLIKDITYTPSVPFSNYSNRKYFQQLNSQYDTVISAVKSKLDNKFHLVYAANQKDGTIAGYTFDYKSKNDTIPPDMGFIICDDAGRILLHSDTSKQLNENISVATDNNASIDALLAGSFAGYFHASYNQNQTLMYAAPINSKYLPSKCAPLYLITFKTLTLSDKSLIHVIRQGAFLSIALMVLVVLLLLFYSIVLNLNNISIFSRSHVYWLFPDASKTAEYIWIQKLIVASFALLLLILFILPEFALFLSFIIALNLALIVFTLLSQRHFIFNEKSQEKKLFFIYLAGTISISAIIAIVLLHFNFKASAIISTLFFHLFFIAYLRKQNRTVLPVTQLQDFKIKTYCTSIASISVFLFAVIPLVISFLIFTNEYQIAEAIKEINKASILNKSASFDTGIYTSELRLIEQISPFTSPYGSKLIESKPTQVITPKIYHTPTANAYAIHILTNQLFWHLKLVLFLLSITFCSYALIKFFTGRFFFFDLSAFYYINPNFFKHPLTNSTTVFSPFSLNDLQTLERFEIGSTYAAPSALPDLLVSTHTKLELINSKAMQLHAPTYKVIWTDLSDIEKYALIDFAFDYFINFKNKLVLVNLMEKGLIIPDAVTGRLRLMNHSFRTFIRKMPTDQYQFSEEFKATTINQNFAKWKTPLAIVALSLLSLVLFAYRAQYEQIIFVAGSVVSSITVISGFLNAYKKH